LRKVITGVKPNPVAICLIFLVCSFQSLFAQKRVSLPRLDPLRPADAQQSPPGLPAPQSAAEQPPPSTPAPQLELFGRYFFTGQIGDESLSPGLAVSTSYQLGPGDQLLVFLGGKAQQQFEVTVSADGQAFLPTVGVFPVLGQSLGEFRRALDERLKRLYSNYSIDVMLIAPKSIRVAVIGEVNSPGNYTLSALNSVLDAMIKAQGLTERGSLRDIQVFRRDSLLGHVDLYDFLLKPHGNENVFLQGGDQIFVPVRKSQVEVTGEVHRQAIYELNPTKKERFSDLIALAGGLTDLAFTPKIELSRMRPEGTLEVFYLDYHKMENGLDSTRNVILKNNDRLHVFSKLDQVPKQVVTIHGEVKNPGEYEYEANMRVSDLILKAGSLTRSAYLLQAEVAKVDPNSSVRPVQIRLSALMDSSDASQDILLEADDHVFVRRIPEWQVGLIVEVRGEVKFPGNYPIVKDSTKLSDVLRHAGGFTKEALIGEAKLIRRREPVLEDKEFERLKSLTRDEMSNLEYEYFVMKQNAADVSEVNVDFYKLMVQGIKSEDVVLEDGDIIHIPRSPHVVMVTGRVAKPGGVLYETKAPLKYYITKAGGYSWDADGDRTKVIKVTGEIIDDEDVQSFSPGDRIWVPRKPDRNYWQIFRDTILVAGQVATIYLVIQTATK